MVALVLVGQAVAISFQVIPNEEKCFQISVLKDAVVHSNFSIDPFLNDGKLFLKVPDFRLARSFNLAAHSARHTGQVHQFRRY